MSAPAAIAASSASSEVRPHILTISFIGHGISHERCSESNSTGARGALVLQCFLELQPSVNKSRCGKVLDCGPDRFEQHDFVVVLVAGAGPRTRSNRWAIRS